MACQLKQFADRETLYETVSAALCSELALALDNHDRAGFVVPGGRTPVAVLQRISAMALPWSKITVTLTDERWVEPAHQASNEGMARQSLLQNNARSARFIPLYTGDETPEQAEVTCRNRLSVFPWHNMICMPGMGDDGHIASLFPCNKGLEKALDLQDNRICLAQTPDPLPPEAPYQRMTLTLSALLNARRIYLVLVGEGKLETLERAERGDDVHEMPVRGILRQTTTRVQVFWAP